VFSGREIVNLLLPLLVQLGKLTFTRTSWLHQKKVLGLTLVGSNVFTLFISTRTLTLVMLLKIARLSLLSTRLP